MTILEDRIAPNAVILWDDLCNYPAWKGHEVIDVVPVHASSASSPVPRCHHCFETGKLLRKVWQRSTALQPVRKAMLCAWCLRRRRQ